MTQSHIDVPFEMYYDTKNGIPIEEAIEQLKALAKIINKQKSIVSDIADIEIDRTEIYVNELVEGSWQEKLIIRLFFKSEEEYEKFKNAISGIEMKDWIKVVLAIGFGAFLYHTYVQTSSKAETKPTVNIEMNNNSGVISLGKSVQLSDEQVNKILEKNSKLTKTEKQAGLDVLNPAKNGGASEIKLAGYSELTIPQETFTDIPEKVPTQENTETEKSFDNMDIYVYASDRDNSASGWAGIVPDLFEHRVKFELGENVDPNKLHGKRKLKANIVVYSKYVSSKKEYRPFLVVITDTV